MSLAYLRPNRSCRLNADFMNNNLVSSSFSSSQHLMMARSLACTKGAGQTGTISHSYIMPSLQCFSLSISMGLSCVSLHRYVSKYFSVEGWFLRALMTKVTTRRNSLTATLQNCASPPLALVFNQWQSRYKGGSNRATGAVGGQRAATLSGGHKSPSASPSPRHTLAPRQESAQGQGGRGQGRNGALRKFHPFIRTLSLDPSISTPSPRQPITISERYWAARRRDLIGYSTVPYQAAEWLAGAGTMRPGTRGDACARERERQRMSISRRGAGSVDICDV